MKKKSIGINAILNTIKQLLSVLFPLITYPYAVRVLHASGIGKVNYADSIVAYFSLIAGLGISVYAVREGAKLRDDKKRFTQFANEVFTINIITTSIAYILLFFCLIIVNKFHAYTALILISSVSIVLKTIGVDWINTIYEDYLFVTVRSIVSHIISLLLLFAFVHDENDIYYYALLTVVVNGIVCISNLFYCRKYVKYRVTTIVNWKKHLTPMLTLFANNLAIMIYVNADITMLGWILGDYYVGIYSAAVKIYTILKNVLVALYSVTIPRLSSYIGRKEIDQFKKLVTDTLNYLTLLLLPIGAGIVTVSEEIIRIIAGSEYLAAIGTLQILGISIIFAIFGGAITCCLNIPLGREKVNMRATILSAFINITLNSFFIRYWKQDGAALTTAFSELFVFMFCYFSLSERKKYIDVSSWIKNLFHALFGFVSIIISGYLIKQVINSTTVRLFTIFFTAIFLYFVELLALKNVYLFEIIKVVKVKINKK